MIDDEYAMFSMASIMACNLAFPIAFALMSKLNPNKYTLFAMVVIANMMMLILRSRMPINFFDYAETQWMGAWAFTFAVAAAYPIIVDRQTALEVQPKKKTR